MVQLFSCLDEAAHLAWSPDSGHLLCMLQHRAVVQVFSVLEPAWTAKIDEGVAGPASLRDQGLWLGSCDSGLVSQQTHTSHRTQSAAACKLVCTPHMRERAGSLYGMVSTAQLCEAGSSYGMVSTAQRCEPSGRPCRTCVGQIRCVSAQESRQHCGVRTDATSCWLQTSRSG